MQSMSKEKATGQQTQLATINLGVTNSTCVRRSLPEKPLSLPVTPSRGTPAATAINLARFVLPIYIPDDGVPGNRSVRHTFFVLFSFLKFALIQSLSPLDSATRDNCIKYLIQIAIATDTKSKQNGRPPSALLSMSTCVHLKVGLYIGSSKPTLSSIDRMDVNFAVASAPKSIRATKTGRKSVYFVTAKGAVQR